MLTQEFIDEMKRKLEQAKTQLTAELAGLPEHTNMDVDEDEVARELQVDEVNQDLIVRIKADLAKIDKALEKMANGTYGVDEEGHEISKERLEALPWADKAIVEHEHTS
jgi:DnaK suppressor protein